MLFGVVSGVDRRMGVLDRRMRRGSFGVNVGHPIVTNGDFVAQLFCAGSSLITLGFLVF